ncbi:unnamed protein product, partial [Brassica oleracea var. botrytis]
DGGASRKAWNWGKFGDGGLEIDVRERRGEPLNEEGKFGGSGGSGGSGGGSTGEVN